MDNSEATWEKHRKRNKGQFDKMFCISILIRINKCIFCFLRLLSCLGNDWICDWNEPKLQQFECEISARICSPGYSWWFVPFQVIIFLSCNVLLFSCTDLYNSLGLVRSIEWSFWFCQSFHTVCFDWFLSGLEWILILDFCWLKLLIFYQAFLWNIRTRLNLSFSACI